MSVQSFKARVFDVVRQIPSGETKSYQEVAILAGSPGAYRAVGRLLASNYDLEIPCHRVIHSDGRQGGYNLGSLKKYNTLIAEGVTYLKPII